NVVVMKFAGVNSVEDAQALRNYVIYIERKSLKLPKDSENHLCDALRYAFEDVKFFKPAVKGISESDVGAISVRDFKGGWDR
ncbi:MAG: hypothetical protein II342_01410, partial [Clostridia bacterium]|nr:hypothetical protein [Clostridia bacterium]